MMTQAYSMLCPSRQLSQGYLGFQADLSGTHGKTTQAKLLLTVIIVSFWRPEQEDSVVRHAIYSVA